MLPKKMQESVVRFSGCSQLFIGEQRAGDRLLRLRLIDKQLGDMKEVDL